MSVANLCSVFLICLSYPGYLFALEDEAIRSGTHDVTRYLLWATHVLPGNPDTVGQPRWLGSFFELQSNVCLSACLPACRSVKIFLSACLLACRHRHVLEDRRELDLSDPKDLHYRVVTSRLAASGESVQL